MPRCISSERRSRATTRKPLRLRKLHGREPRTTVLSSSAGWVRPARVPAVEADAAIATQLRSIILLTLGTYLLTRLALKSLWTRLTHNGNLKTPEEAGELSFEDAPKRRELHAHELRGSHYGIIVEETADAVAGLSGAYGGTNADFVLANGTGTARGSG